MTKSSTAADAMKPGGQAPAAAPLIEVALAGLWRPARPCAEVLLTRRAATAHLGGLWELPGGKLERGEDVPAALRRELREELGVEPPDLEPLVCLEHCYPDRTVRLHVLVGLLAPPGPFRAAEHRWVRVDELADVPLPEANAAINEALRQRLEFAPTSR